MKSEAPDMKYACHDGIWTRFYPETDAGDEAYNIMAQADPDGVVAFLAPQVPGVLAQLRAAGLAVRKVKPAKILSADGLDALLSDLEKIAPSVPTPQPETTGYCTMGVGCDEAGVCFAAANGQPEQCPKS